MRSMCGADAGCLAINYWILNHNLRNQHIRNAQAITIYESNGRLALLEDDFAEFYKVRSLSASLSLSLSLSLARSLARSFSPSFSLSPSRALSLSAAPPLLPLASHALFVPELHVLFFSTYLSPRMTFPIPLSLPR